MVGQGASEDVVVVADSWFEPVDAASRLLCLNGEEATRLEVAMKNNDVRMQCILSSEGKWRNDRLQVLHSKTGIVEENIRRNVEGANKNGRATRT